MQIDRDLYRTLTKMSYAGETSLSALVNDMLKEYLHTYVLSKRMGHMLMAKEIVKIAVNEMSDEEIKQASAANAIRYREGALIDYGRPSLAVYLDLIRSFVKANGFDMEVSKNAETGNHVLIVMFRMGPKFSQFLGNTYRILLEEFADIGKIEMTDTSAYFEYQPKESFQRRE
ncbi:MAG: hypothetical protein AB1753_01915 [Thermoproteota archaeon]